MDINSIQPGRINVSFQAVDRSRAFGNEGIMKTYISILLVLLGSLFADGFDIAELDINLVGYYDTPSSAYAVNVDGDYAYIADGIVCLIVLDVSDPSTPELVSTFDGESLDSYDLFKQGDYVQIAGWGSAPRIVNVSDPTSPYQESYLSCPGGAWGICANETNVFVALPYSGLGLGVFDAVDPTSPAFLGVFVTPGNAEAVYVDGDYAYVACEDEGLRIIDISDPTELTEAGFIVPPESHRCRAIYVDDHFAYLGDWSSYLFVIDIFDPTAPVLLSSFATRSQIHDVYVQDNLAYIANDEDGLTIVDVSSPTAPREVGTYDTPDNARGVYFDGSHVYLACQASGLYIFETSPIEPDSFGDYPEIYSFIGEAGCPDTTVYFIGDTIHGYMGYAIMPDSSYLTGRIIDYPPPYRSFWLDSVATRDFYIGDYRCDFYIDLWSYIPLHSDTLTFSFEFCDSSGMFCDTCSIVYEILDTSTAPSENHPPEFLECTDTIFYLYDWIDTYTSYVEDPDSHTITIGWIEYPEPYRSWYIDSFSVSYYPPWFGQYWIQVMSVPPPGGYEFAVEACDEYGLCDTCSFVFYVPDTSTSIDTSSMTFDIFTGWNLIGGLITPIDAREFTTYSCIVPPVYGYNSVAGVYEATDSLLYKKGYWILSIEDTVISIEE